MSVTQELGARTNVDPLRGGCSEPPGSQSRPPQVPPSVLPPLLGLESSPQLSQLSWWAFSPFKAVRPAVATDISLSSLSFLGNRNYPEYGPQLHHMVVWACRQRSWFELGAGQGVDRSRLGEKATSLIRRTQHKLLLNDSHVSSITSSLGSLLIFILPVHRYLLPRNKCTDLKSSSARVLLYRNMCRHSIWYRHPWCACYWETFHGFPLAIVNIDEGTLKMWNIFMHLEVSPKFSLWTDSRWKNLKVENMRPKWKKHEGKKDEAQLRLRWYDKKHTCKRLE